MFRHDQYSKASRFTLVEMMTVVAIVAVLAAIAIPLYQDYQIEVRLTEAAVNSDGLWTALSSSKDEFTAGFSTGTPWPTIGFGIGKTPQPWSGAPAQFATIGWAPDGDVRCGYSMRYTLATQLLTGIVTCNLDEDGNEFYVGTSSQGIPPSPPWIDAECGGTGEAVSVPGMGWNPVVLSLPCR